LGVGIVPVLVGSAATGSVTGWKLAAALLVGGGLQVGVNYANDYFDGVRGIDTAERTGPRRLTSSGLVRPKAVLVAALIALGVAGIAGLALALATSPIPILILGALAVTAALLYSGGPRPYANLGLGELIVFCFFGPAAVCGTAYVMVRTVPAAAWWSSVTLGLLAVAILVANNLRDIPTDAATGKRTLAVRIGDPRTRLAYRVCMVGAFTVVALGVIAGVIEPDVGLPQWALIGLAAWPLAIRPMQTVGTASGPDLIPVLTGTAAVHAACGSLLALAFVLWHAAGS
jgi:1,4-dihydroxy-2-naphthoate octaprenyltransferase